MQKTATQETAMQKSCNAKKPATRQESQSRRSAVLKHQPPPDSNLHQTTPTLPPGSPSNQGNANKNCNTKKLLRKKNCNAKKTALQKTAMQKNCNAKKTATRKNCNAKKTAPQKKLQRKKTATQKNYNAKKNCIAKNCNAKKTATQK